MIWLLAIGCTVMFIVDSLWHFKLMTRNYSFNYDGRHILYSAYYTRNPNNLNTVKFKTVFHYLLGII